MTNIWAIHHHNHHHSSRQDLLKNVIGDVVDVVWWDDVVCVLAASPAHNGYHLLHHHHHCYTKTMMEQHCDHLSTESRDCPLKSEKSKQHASPLSSQHSASSWQWCLRPTHTNRTTRHIIPFITPCKAAAGAPQDNLGRRMIPGERKPTWNKIQHAVFCISQGTNCVRETDPFEQSLLSTHSCISESSSMQKPLSIESSACLRQT